MFAAFCALAVEEMSLGLCGSVAQYASCGNSVVELIHLFIHREPPMYELGDGYSFAVFQGC